MKNTLRRIIAWFLVLTMVFGSNSMTTLAEAFSEISDGAEYLSDSNSAAIFEEVLSDDPVEVPEDFAIFEQVEQDGTGEENAIFIDERNEIGPVLEEETELHYIRVQMGMTVYSDAELKTPIGSIGAETIVYAETVEKNGESSNVYWVIFDTEDGQMKEGYMDGVGIGFLNEEETINALVSVKTERVVNGYPITVILFIETEPNPEVLVDGIWTYEVTGQYARILECLDYAAEMLEVPYVLGGYYVNEIGECAFANNTSLQRLYVHGNITSIADTAFADNNVFLSGYNGTEVMRYAKVQEMGFKNRTDLGDSVLQETVVDFSYASETSYEFLGQYAIRMNYPEAENLQVGSIFYLPKAYEGDILKVFKVDSITMEPSSEILFVSEAALEESFVHLEIHEDLVPDWSGAVWAEGVELVEEKGKYGTSLNEKVVLSFSPSFKTKADDGSAKAVEVKVEGNLELGMTGKLEVDVDVLPLLSFNSFDFNLDVDGQASAGISVGAGNDDIAKEKFEKYALGESPNLALKEVTKVWDRIQKDIPVGAVPINGKDLSTSAYVGIYIRVAIGGKVEVVSKLHGTLINLNYTKGKGWSRSHNVQWNPLSISAAVDFDFGIVGIAEVKCMGIGRVATLEAFAGLNINAELNMDILKSLAAEYSSNSGGGTAKYQNFLKCLDINIKFKLEVTLKTDIKFLEKELTKHCDFEITKSGKWGIVNAEWPLFSWHLEAPGLDFIHWKLTDPCTNSFVTVDFYTGTEEKVNSLKLVNNSAIGSSKIPTLTKTPGTLDGWYVYEDCSGPIEYKNGVGTRRKWNFGSDKVSGDTTLYAEWITDKTYPVVFKPNYTSKDPAKPVPNDIEQQCGEGACVMDPGQLKRDDYRFKGWYLDSAQTKQWNFSSDTVTADKLTNGKLILYAGWEYEEGYDPNKVDTGNNGVVSFNGHSYKHIMTYKSYAEAEADARSQGGYLCTINSAEEQAFLQKYLYNDCAQTYLWLGMVSNDGWNYWKTGEKVGYTNWRTSPVATASQYNAVLVRSSGLWETLSNTETAHYVIEWGTPSTDPNYKTKPKSDFTYTPNGDGSTATVTGIDAEAASGKANLEIPTVNPDGLVVTGIADSAFKGNTTIETIKIPSTVTSIGSSVFENCNKLRSVTIPDSVTHMGTKVFKECGPLESVVWSRGLTAIPNETFYNCSNLKSISNIDNVTEIGSYAFYYAGKLAEFSFPARLVTIGRDAFYYCKSLQTLVLPDQLRTIDYYAFYGCSGVTKISIPESVTNIYSDAFRNCSAATEIYLPKTIAESGISYYAFDYVNGVFYVYRDTGADAWAKKRGKTIRYLGTQQKVKYVLREDGSILTEEYVDTGKRLTEPKTSREGYKLAGWYKDPEFRRQWNFAVDKVPESDLTLYAKWETISSDFKYTVVNGKVKITGYSGSDTVVRIPSQLAGCNVTGIEEGAFTNSNIEEIVIPETVNLIAAGAFNCSSLKRISVIRDTYYSVHADGVLYSANGKVLIYAPQGSNYFTYTVPEGVTTIRSYAFRQHPELKKIVIPDTVTALEKNAFELNNSLILYGSVGTCAAKTYAEKNLLSYNIYTVTYVYDGTVLYNGNAEAGKCIDSYFEPMTDFFSFGGWYKDAQTTQRWEFKTAKMPQEDLTLYLKWDTVFDVAPYGNALNITGYRGSSRQIVIPDTIGGKAVTGIDSGAFLRSNARTIQIPDTVTTIEDNAFPASTILICSESSAARTYAVNHGMSWRNPVYTIHFEVDGGSEVADMKVVPGKKVVLPIPVRSNYYFYGWYSDTSYMDSVKWDNDTLMPDNDVTLYACWRSATTGVTNDFAYNILPDGTIEISKYSGDKTILSVPESINGYKVSAVGDYAFYENRTLVSVTLPNEVTRIGKYAFAESTVRSVKGAKKLAAIEEGAFKGATALKEIALTTYLRTIGDCAFQRCSSLLSITLPKGTESIGFRAFKDCTYLESVNFTTTIFYIGKEAFASCPRLKTVSVPTSLFGTAKDAFDEGIVITYKSSTSINFITFNICGNTIETTWNKVINAESYVIESKRSTNRTYEKKLTVNDTRAKLALGAYGVTYDVKVVALDAAGNVLCESTPVEAYLSRLSTPSVKSVKQVGKSTATMVIEGVSNAEGYEVERAYSEESEFELLKDVTTTSFQNTGLLKGLDYYYRVRAYVTTDGVRSYSRYSDVYWFHMPLKYLTTPKELTVRQSSTNAVAISWQAVDGADGYLVYRSVNGGTEKLLRQTTDITATNTSLTMGSTFTYRVAAYYTEGTTQYIGKKSEAVVFGLKEIATPEITELKQTTASGATLSWSPVKGATGYKIYRATAEGEQLTWLKNISTGATSASLTGMTPGTTYFYAVRAFVKKEDGTVYEGADSPAASIRLNQVLQVSGLKAVLSMPGKVKLNWNSLDGVTGYEVWMSTANEENYELISTVTSTVATVENLKDGIKYYFKVRGYTGTGSAKVYGMDSEEKSVAVRGATELKVAEQNGATAVQLYWTKLDSAAGYEIWSKTGSEEYVLEKTVKATSATVTGLTVGSNYSFKIIPYQMDEKGNKQTGFTSNLKSVYILGATKITSLERSGGSEVTLTWEKAVGASGYNIYRCDTIDGIFKKIKSVSGLTESNTGLVKGNAYYYKIVPYRTVNGVAVEGRPSGAKGIRILDRTTITSIEQTGAQTLTVVWNPVEKATCYRIYRSNTQNGTYTLLKKVTGSTSATSVGLTQGKWYYYTVEAGSEEDNTTYYGLQSAAKGGYVTTMEKPVITTRVQSSENTIRLNWDKVTGAAGYEVFRSTSENGTYTKLTAVASPTCQDTSLSSGNTYYYKVRPYKTVSNTTVRGILSDPVGVRILGVTRITSLERTSATRVDLKWDRVSNATGYNLYRSQTVSGTYTLIKTTTDTTAYNSALTRNSTYYYKVAPVYEKGTVSSVGPMSAVKSISLYDIGTPAITQIKQVKGGTVSLTWSRGTNAEGYEIFIAGQNDTEFTKVKTTTETSAETKMNLEDGKTFRYKVRSYATVNGSRQYSPYSQEAKITLMKTPEFQFLYQTGSNRVEMQWTGNGIETGYEVYRKRPDGTFMKLKTVTENVATNTSLTVGETYTYKIRAMRTENGVTSYSNYSEIRTITLIPYTTGGKYPECLHSYDNNMDESWEYSINGANTLLVKFDSQFKLENNYDKLYISDASGNSVGNSYWTGTSLAGKSILVPGDTVKLRLTTDRSTTYYGFRVELIVPAGQ